MNHGSVPGPQYPGGNAFRSFPRGLTPEMNMPHGRPSLTNDAIQRVRFRLILRFSRTFESEI